MWIDSKVSLWWRRGCCSSTLIMSQSSGDVQLMLSSHSHYFPRLYSVPSLASLGTDLSSLHKWLDNQYMRFGTPLLTSLQWGHGLLVLLVAVWVWCSGGRTPSTPAEWGPSALPLIDIGKGDLMWIIWPMLQDALGCWLRSHNADSRMMCTSRIAQALVWRRW